MRSRLWLCVSASAFALVSMTLASDHDDTSELRTLGRHDARITDLHVFTRGTSLVLSLCTNPTIPAGTTEYIFPSDLTLRIAIDNDCEVRFDDAQAVAQYGGTIVSPAHIEEDLVFEVTFDKNGEGRLRTVGMPGKLDKSVSFFYGLRDDPFIRGPRNGRNVAAVVLELPLSSVLGPQPTLLVWATAKVPDVRGPMSELAGRSLRSQMPENVALNTERPREHYALFGVPPDVIIFDTSRPCVFPNGRDLTDDVVDMVGDARILANDTPFPSANDVPFLDAFPYLAPHQ